MKLCRYHDLTFCDKHENQCFKGEECVYTDHPTARCCVCTGLYIPPALDEALHNNSTIAEYQRRYNIMQAHKQAEAISELDARKAQAFDAFYEQCEQEDHEQIARDAWDAGCEWMASQLE